MPNTNTPGHITMTVGSTKTKLIIDPATYSMVDITDFSPRAVASTPTLSTLGLYLDVGQQSFKHGFGYVDFSEPESYWYSGHQVDTRHGFAGLWTNYETLTVPLTGTISSFVVHHNLVFLGGTVVRTIRYGTSSILDVVGGINGGDMISNGEYILIARTAARMLVADAWQVSGFSGGNTVITATHPSGNGTAPAWATNQWNTGGNTAIVIAWARDGSWIQSKSVVTNTATTITTTAWTSVPAGAVDFFVYMNAGNSLNPPDYFERLAIFGGEVWATEYKTNYIHHWTESIASDAEGHGTTDAAAIAVGPPGQSMLRIVPFQTQLWCFRPDGVWTINEDDADALSYHTLAYDTEASLSNFSSAVVWDGYMVYPVRNKLYKYRSGQQDITPPTTDRYPPYKAFGGFSGLTTRGRFLFVLGKSNEANADESTETTTGFVSLLCFDGVGWHRLMDLPATAPTVYSLFVDPQNDYLYIYAYAAADYLWRVRLQPYSELPYGSYPTTGSHNLYTSNFTLGLPRIPKSFASFIIHGKFQSGTSVVVSYQIDDATSWTTLGTIDADMEELSFPTGTTGKYIRFRLALATSNAARTPIIDAIILKTMLRPRVQYGITCDVIVSDGLSDQALNAVGHTAKETRTNLMAARDSVAPFTLVDLWGDSHTAYLSSMQIRPIAYEDSDAIQSVARCTFVFV